MARILMAWELGQNFGHVFPLLPVAKRLRDAGHDVVFALKDLRQVGAMVTAEGFAMLQAPAHPGLQAGTEVDPPESMTDVLWRFGYADPSVLSSYLHAWSALLRVLRTDLLVASYAPTALLAARSMTLRTCLVGMPFELPAPVFPSPSFRPWLGTGEDTLTHREDSLVRAVNQSLRAARSKTISAIWEVFAADRQVLWTFPQLDPFAGRRRPPHGKDVEYAGGIFDPSMGSDPQWPPQEGNRIFGYLRLSEARLRDLVESLGEVDAAFCLVVPNLGTGLDSAVCTRNVRVSREPVRLSSALSECSAVLSYGSHGTICASLLAGKPLVLVPEQMADMFLARHVAQLGAAALAKPQEPSSIAKACRDVLTVPKYGLAARSFQAHYAGYNVALQTARLAAVLDGLVNSEAPVA